MSIRINFVLYNENGEQIGYITPGTVSITSNTNDLDLLQRKLIGFLGFIRSEDPHEGLYRTAVERDLNLFQKTHHFRPSHIEEYCFAFPDLRLTRFPFCEEK